MADQPTQTLANHARYVPGYHFVTFSILLANLIWALVQLARSPGTGSVIAAALGIALVMLALYARTFALRAQDRIIRLEERLRLGQELPVELRGRIGEFTTDQLVALRFASDAELPTLAQRVLDEKLSDRQAIKALIRTWRPDHLRV